MTQATTVRSALAQAARVLEATSPTARLDAELLLSHVLGWSRARVLAEGQHQLSLEQQTAFAALLERRQNLEPVAYLVGEREFFGLMFEVTPATLVPRPETELLVERALQWALDRNNSTTVRVADIGTGTGCIAIAFAVHHPQSRVVAVDRSPEALVVAARNLVRHDVAERVWLVEGDLLEPLEKSIDLLLSNPPYVVMSEIDENVRQHEPHLALDGGLDGLDIYRRLLAAAPAKLAPGGAVMLEIGATQAKAVSALGTKHFPEAHITVYKDLAGLDRVVVIQN